MAWCDLGRAVSQSRAGKAGGEWQRTAGAGGEGEQAGRAGWRTQGLLGAMGAGAPGARHSGAARVAYLEEGLVGADRLVRGQHDVGLDDARPLPALCREPQVVLLRYGWAGTWPAGRLWEPQQDAAPPRLWAAVRGCTQTGVARGQQARKTRQARVCWGGMRACKSVMGRRARVAPGWRRGPGRYRRTPRSSCRSRSPPRAASGPAWSAVR